MPVKWSYKNEDNSYRVVEVGNAVRLYRNNVLHSQWNPKKPVSGKLWDLFLVSVLGLKVEVSNVLVLGAGGGSVINLIHYFYPKAKIFAVDVDELHLKIAKKYFRINTKNCSLIHADAEQWLKCYKGKKFDLIIDDVFTEINDIPFRSIEDNKNWAKYLLRTLKSDGFIVFNFADKKEWKKNFNLWNKSVKNKYIGVAAHYKCENKIVHLSKQDISYRNIKSGLVACEEYKMYLKKSVISYQTVQGHVGR